MQFGDFNIRSFRFAVVEDLNAILFDFRAGSKISEVRMGRTTEPTSSSAMVSFGPKCMFIGQKWHVDFRPTTTLAQKKAFEQHPLVCGQV